jgi:hypothetical protein
MYDLSEKTTRAQGDLRVLKIAIESYYHNQGHYPNEAKYQTLLLQASPQIVEEVLYDPFSKGGRSEYKYTLSKNKKYYIIYSKGKSGNDLAAIYDSGIVKAKKSVIWEGNGRY